MKRRFRKLVDQHRHRIFTFAYYHLGNREEAEDASQEVILRMWENWEKIESSKLPAWIRRVTRNACIDAIRKRNRYRATVVPEDDSEAKVCTSSVGAEEEAILRTIDLRERIENALVCLEEPYRTIVILREIQELSYEEISEALDMPLGTIKAYLHRGRRLMRAQLKRQPA